MWTVQPTTQMLAIFAEAAAGEGIYLVSRQFEAELMKLVMASDKSVAEMAKAHLEESQLPVQ